MNCVALVTDLIFETKIRSTAEAVGVDVHTVATLNELQAALKEGDPALVIIDLNETSCAPTEAVSLASRHASCPRIVAYGSHVQTDLMQAAETAGAHDVWPKSRFSMQLSFLLQEIQNGA